MEKHTINKGWVSVHRQLLDNPISSKPTYLSVWIHLLLMANHKETSFIWNGKKQIVKEGQVLTGLKKLSEKTGIAQATIYRILKYLENEKQIEQQKTTKYTLITITNWDKYQKNEKQNEKQMKNKRKTNEKQMKTYNNVNNENNENNISNDMDLENPVGQDISIKEKKEYGNPDINRFINGMNKYLKVKLPEDKTARRVAKNALDLLTKYRKNGEVKKGREFLDDDVWQNLKNFLSDYMEIKVEKGYSAQSWNTLYRNIQLWVANGGSFGDISKLNKQKNGIINDGYRTSEY